MPQAQVQDYINGIAMIRKMSTKPIGAEIPIFKTQFCKDHKLDARLFLILESLGIIRTEIATPRDGSFITWLHKEASNETSSFLATRVQAEIYTLNKKAKAKWKSSKEIKRVPAPTPTPLKHSLTLTETFETDPDPIATPHTKESFLINSDFSITGAISKESLLEKLSILINDQTITSAQILITYSTE